MHASTRSEVEARFNKALNFSLGLFISFSLSVMLAILREKPSTRRVVVQFETVYGTSLKHILVAIYRNRCLFFMVKPDLFASGA